jgi:hypothetical protein
MSSLTSRLTTLQANQTSFTGIAFVRVIAPDTPTPPCDPFTLQIYFLTDVTVLSPPFSGTTALTPASIVIHEANNDPNVPNLLLASPTLTFTQDSLDACITILQVQVQSPNDFRQYRLRIDDPNAGSPPGTAPLSRIDPFFNDVLFSFQIGCDTELDCEPQPVVCPVDPPVDFPVDYLARDYVSLKNALLDFAAHRYPEWQLPIEADVGSLVMEVMAALGDEFSYIQDRYAREAFLETATERRTLRKKARLLDYDIHDGSSATTLLAVDFPGPKLGPSDTPSNPSVSAGTSIWAFNVGVPPVEFQVGLGLGDLLDGLSPPKQFALSNAWSPENLAPHWFDSSTQCLPVGATEVLVEGTIFQFNTTLANAAAAGNLIMLLATNPPDPAIPQRRLFVHVTSLTQAFDPLAPAPPPASPGAIGLPLTRITWAAQDALPFQINQAFLSLNLNVVPATAGHTFGRGGDTDDPPAQFVIHPDTPGTVPSAVEREGALATQLDPSVVQARPTVYLSSLPGTDTGGLGFLGPSLRETLPEIRLTDNTTGIEWQFTSSLLNATPDDAAFTLEDGMWRRIVGYQHDDQTFVQNDYATGTGYTIRFGDGVFGLSPQTNAQFSAVYRLNPGAQANVAADTITQKTLPVPSSGIPIPIPTQFQWPAGVTVTNPWPVQDGIDPESASDIKLLTPEAFKADVFFAVTPDDYSVQAQRLPFVNRAHATLRWTGSWTTVFAAAEPFGSFTLTDLQKAQLEGWLNCVRQAGRDVIVKDPKFATIDLRITICIQQFAYAGQVVQLVTDALLGHGGARPQKGFFDPTNFTFGVPLRRSALESTIQEVPGVQAVLDLSIRKRGQTEFQEFDQLSLSVSPDEVVELLNDPTQPDRGTLQIATVGGS